MIVVTVREAGVEAARRRIQALGSGAGMLELRLDELAGGWADLVAESPLPVLATCRPRALGGGFDGPEEDRVRRLRRALDAGARMIDVEAGSRAADELLDDLPPGRLVLSHHDFEPGTARLDEHLARLLAAPPGVTVKLAYTVRCSSDGLHARRLLDTCAALERPAVVVPMGEAGLPGRLLAPAWGSAWTYAAADGGRPAAPGQQPLSEMAGLYDVDAIGPGSVLTGILGWPVAGSLSPWMHNRALRGAGIDGRYLPFPEEDAADVVLNAPAWGLLGLSVTHPHKERPLPWLDGLSESARGCGAVNTLTFADGRVTGDNTDAAAARLALEAALPPGWSWPGRQVAVVGAGGAARAAAWELARRGAEVCLYNRDAVRGEAAAAAAGVARRPLAELPGRPRDVLVHATPVGMWPGTDDMAVPAEAVDGALVLDMVSNPRRTRLLATAAARGIPVQEGLAMLVLQGEEQFRLWHGAAPPPGMFLEGALSGLAAGRG